MSRFKKWTKPSLKNNELTQWNWMVQHPENLSLGEMSDIGAFTYINAKNGVEIGQSVQIGSHCSIYSYSSIDDKNGQVFIGKGACVGSHTTIMPGVKIGANAIVGAHSFVNKDIPENATAYGVPAKVVKNNEAV